MTLCNYSLNDHLGSLECSVKHGFRSFLSKTDVELIPRVKRIGRVINAETDTVTYYSYDAWGNPRDNNDWTTKVNTELFADRGFTGHEHLVEFGLIDMNGRVYDPLVGLFLSPDPFLQEPTNPLNFNRYSYVLNNPLKFVDPTGYVYSIKRVEWEEKVSEAMAMSSGSGRSPADRSVNW